VGSLSCAGRLGRRSVTFRLFNLAWEEAPIVVIDVETTGLVPGLDGAVQVALVRFEKRKVVGKFSSLLNPGRWIPKEATAVHGITYEQVADAPHIETVFLDARVRELLKDAQPAAYNAHFDQRFVPMSVFEDWTWPWLDPLVAVRAVDRFVRGEGRHKLEAACARRGIPLVGAHHAAADAEAAGRLLYHVLSEVPQIVDQSLGTVLAWQRRTEADQWANFNVWRCAQREVELEKTKVAGGVKKKPKPKRRTK
jgi:DNA polymerase III epsilon subunit-like protein